MPFGGARKGAGPDDLRAGIITALSSKGAGGEWVAVYLDGRHAFDLSARCAVEAHLAKDEFVSEERQALLLQQDEPERARAAALGYLSRRDATAGQVAGKLQTAGFSDVVVSDVISWLRDRGYVDDRRFAAAYAGERLRGGWGRQRIVSELLKKGVSRDMLAGEAWGELIDELGVADDMEQVLPLVRRRFAGQLRADPEGARRRISGFLARRGHDWPTIAAVVKMLQEESGTGDDAAPSGGLS